MTNGKKLAGLGLAAALLASSAVMPASAAPRDATTAAKSAAAQDVSAAKRHRNVRRQHVYHRHHRPGVVEGVAGAAIGLATAPLWLFGGGPGYQAYNDAPPPYYRGDNVAPVVRTPNGPYYAYNRYSGQVYGSCVLDLGYGRTQPCDAGGR